LRHFFAQSEINLKNGFYSDDIFNVEKLLLKKGKISKEVLAAQKNLIKLFRNIQLGLGVLQCQTLPSSSHISG
jgi:hypothetical protein